MTLPTSFRRSAKIGEATRVRRHDECPELLRRQLTRAVDNRCALCWGYRRLQAHRAIVPGGRYDENNVVMLCEACHRDVLKQPRLGRALMGLRKHLELLVTLHKTIAPHKPLSETLSRWDCRRVTHGRDVLLDTLGPLFRQIPEDERESVSDVRMWLDEMSTWRRVRAAADHIIASRTLRDARALLVRQIAAQRDYPRTPQLLEQLGAIRSKGGLRRFYTDEVFRLEDYLIVEMCRGVAAGLLYFHYYFKYRYAFVSYLILEKLGSRRFSLPRRSLDLLVTRGLLAALKKNHPECLGVMMEVDLEMTPPANELPRGRGLYRLFRLRYPNLRRIEAFYYQPGAARHDERTEKPMALLWYPLKADKRYQARSWIARREYATMLDFVYHGIYEDEADNLAKNFDKEQFSSYAKYLETLKEEILARTPPKILLS